LLNVVGLKQIDVATFCILCDHTKSDPACRIRGPSKLPKCS